MPITFTTNHFIHQKETLYSQNFQRPFACNNDHYPLNLKGNSTSTNLLGQNRTGTLCPSAEGNQRKKGAKKVQEMGEETPVQVPLYLSPFSQKFLASGNIHTFPKRKKNGLPAFLLQTDDPTGK